MDGEVPGAIRDMAAQSIQVIATPSLSTMRHNGPVCGPVCGAMSRSAMPGAGSGPPSVRGKAIGCEGRRR